MSDASPRADSLSTRRDSVAVVIPAYNNGPFLPQAIQSVLEQTRAVDEIIVVDDGSTDDTPQQIQRFAGSIQYLRQQNSGPAAARNLGISRAKGHYVAFLDADDQWVSGKIERQLDVMRRFGKDVLVVGDMAEIGIDGAVLVDSVLRKHGMLDRFRDLAEGPVPQALAQLVKKNFVPTGTVLVRRAILDEVGAFNRDIRYGEDLELWCRIAARYPVICLPEVHLLRRQHGTNATKSTEPMLRDLTRVMERIRAWGSSELRRQGIDPDRIVAEAWSDLGYWHFARGEHAESRHSFARSFAEKPSVRAATYALASSLPAGVTRSLRRIKQKLARTDDR